MSVSATDFRSALSRFAAGVAVVTTRDGDGRPTGLTASAFTAVSLDPPLVLACIDRAATSHAAVDRHGWFAINVLAAGHRDLARRFAASGGDKFAAVAYRDGHAGVPLLEEALTSIECRVRHRYEGGDHTIFVGHVERVSVGSGAPLIYFQGSYRGLASPE